jgi:Tfp pilus assembly protein PilN
MQLMLVVWGAVTLLLVVLLIYRSTLVMHEDDQLFLSDAESQLAQEQHDLQGRMSKIQPFVRILGTASVGLLVIMGGMVLMDVYQHMK